VGAPSARVSGRRALPDESGNPGVHQVSRVVSASVRRVWTPNTANSSNAAVGETARRRLRDHTGPPPKGGPYVVRLKPDITSKPDHTYQKSHRAENFTNRGW